MVSVLKYSTIDKTNLLFCQQSGRLSKELDLVSHHVRTKLDELKRQEVGRLRMLIKAKLDSLHGKCYIKGRKFSKSGC